MDALGTNAVDDAEALLSLGDDDLNGVGGDAEDVTDLRDTPDGAHDVDRERVLEENDKRAPGADRLGVADRKLLNLDRDPAPS